MTLISIILGTRPEAIKLAPVILKFSSSKDFDLRIISTGQHKEMVHQILKLFDIRPHTDLKLMSEKQTLTHITCKTISGLEKEFDKYYFVCSINSYSQIYLEELLSAVPQVLI